LRERVILTRCETVRRLCPHSLLHYCQYVPLDCASGSVLDAKPLVAFQLRGKENERGNDASPTYCFITTWPRCHLQPSTLELIASFNFNPRRHFIPLQLQSCLPTSSLVAANYNPRHHLNSKPRRCAISSPSPRWPRCA
jgi:hypothetical protein